MSERDLDKASADISTAIYDWLDAEVVSSGEGRNKYLDGKDQDPQVAEKKFQDIYRRLSLPYDDERNWIAQKDKSHQGRWPQWLETYSFDPLNEFICARVAFAPLMTVSGAYRAQAVLQSKTAQEYANKRSDAVGIDIKKTVSSQLRERLPSGKFSEADIALEGLNRLFDHAYSQSEAHIRIMIERLSRGYDEGVEDSRSVRSMQVSQYNHIKLVTDCVILAAKIRRGDLQAVPFLEPQSITDQSRSTYYPLREAVNWAEVMAA